MPDKFRFDHLPTWGIVYHRCIDCGFPGEPERTLTEKERERHFNEHVKKNKKELERAQKDNLAKARKAKRQKEREEALIDERFGQEVME